MIRRFSFLPGKIEIIFQDSKVTHREFTCESIDLYQAFVAHVVANEKVVEMLDDCDSIQFSPSVPVVLKWLVHSWNIVCIGLIYVMIGKLIIQPIDSYLSKELV